MTRTPSRTDRIETTAEVITRSADISSGENTTTWMAAVAPAGKENAIPVAETIGLPNDLFTNAVDYRTYRLEIRSARYDVSTARLINNYRKKLEVEMKTHIFGG